MKKQSVAAFLAVLTILSTLFLGAYQVTATSYCDAVVYDEAGVFGSKAADVEKAAGKLINLGADVRVRTTKTLNGEATIDALEKRIEGSCPSWLTPDRRTRKNNLVVLMAATEAKKSGVYYGAEWNQSLGANSNWSRVRTDFMNPRFRDGDWAGGIIRGLDEISRLVDLQIHPPAVSPPVAPQQPVIVIPPSQPTQPADYSGLWQVLKWLVFVVIAVLIAAGAYLVYNTRSRLRAAQLKAKSAKEDARIRFIRLSDAVPAAVESANGISANVSVDDTKPITDSARRLDALFNAVANEYNGRNQPANDPNRSGRSEYEYNEITKAYEKLLGSIRETEELAEAVKSSVGLLEKTIAESRRIIDETAVVNTRATDQIKALNVQGYKTDPINDVLHQADSSFIEAKSFAGNKQFAKSLKSAENAKSLMGKAIKLAEELPVLKGRIDSQASALVKRVEQVKTAIVEGRSVFERISKKYASSSWESVRGNGGESEKRINLVLAVLPKITEFASMQNQEWLKAQDSLNQAAAWLDEAESFMRSIVERERHLDVAEKDAPMEARTAEQDIAKAWEYMRSYDDDRVIRNLTMLNRLAVYLCHPKQMESSIPYSSDHGPEIFKFGVKRLG